MGECLVKTAKDSQRSRNFGVWKKLNPKPFDKSEPTRKSVDFLQGEEMVKGEKRKAIYQAQKRLTAAYVPGKSKPCRIIKILIQLIDILKSYCQKQGLQPRRTSRL